MILETRDLKYITATFKFRPEAPQNYNMIWSLHGLFCRRGGGILLPFTSHSRWMLTLYLLWNNTLLSKHAGKASLYSSTSRLPLATTGRRHSEHRGLGSRYSHNKISSQPDQREKGVLQGSSQGQALATKCPQVSSLHSTDVTLWRDGVISKGIALEGNKTDKNRKSVYLSGINSRVGEISSTEVSRQWLYSVYTIIHPGKQRGVEHWKQLTNCSEYKVNLKFQKLKC